MREILSRRKRIDTGALVFGTHIIMRHNDSRKHEHHFIIPNNTDMSYGVLLESSPLKGLLTRAVVVIKGNKVVYSEQVAEITTEPNYEAAINAVETAS